MNLLFLFFCYSFSFFFFIFNPLRSQERFFFFVGFQCVRFNVFPTGQHSVHFLIEFFFFFFLFRFVCFCACVFFLLWSSWGQVSQLSVTDIKDLSKANVKQTVFYELLTNTE